ncbi:unnamed protein product [Caenorhabditis bovis]|uniref:Uncharacterized protein n=1 Tax=Caenorhabditis bovis TaxID=2654633 RepID=A0A8S1FA97_9PELO|nr:unnamed protein product [Caenorhabditis bovis]
MLYLSSISKSLDREDIGDVCAKLVVLDCQKGLHEHQKSLCSILHRIASLSSSVDFDFIEHALKIILRNLQNAEEECFALLLANCNPAGIVFADFLLRHRNRQLSHQEVERIASASNFPLDRIAALSRLIRYSKHEKTAKNLVMKQLENVNVSSEFPLRFLTELAYFDVGHPIIILNDLASTSKATLFPSVYSLPFQFDILATGFCNFVPKYQSRDGDPLLPLIMRIFQITEEIQLGEEHISKLAEMDIVVYEPQIVAVIIDLIRRDIKAEEFQNELGDIWTILYRIRYDNIYNAAAYFCALFTLARAQALFKIKKRLMLMVRDTILKPLHEQIVDFKQAGGCEKMVRAEECLGSEMFETVVYSYKVAMEAVNTFLNSP